MGWLANVSVSRKVAALAAAGVLAAVTVAVFGTWWENRAS